MDAVAAGESIFFDGGIPSRPEIVELGEGGRRRANEYLKAGYKLIGIQTAVISSAHPDGTFFVKHSPLYILGRTEEVEHFEPSK